MNKESFIVNRNTLLHVSNLLGHLQGELYVTVTLGLHFTVEWECAVDCVLRCFWRREPSAVPACTHVMRATVRRQPFRRCIVPCNLCACVRACVRACVCSTHTHAHAHAQVTVARITWVHFHLFYMFLSMFPCHLQYGQLRQPATIGQPCTAVIQCTTCESPSGWPRRAETCRSELA
jgi:hypothetical protein